MAPKQGLLTIYFIICDWVYLGMLKAVYNLRGHLRAAISLNIA